MANSISLYLSYHPIGSISVDTTRISGEGGPINAQLVIPLDIQLCDQPDDAMLAVGSIRALLGTSDNVQANNAICPPAYEDLIAATPPFRVRSLQTGQVPGTVELRFFLTPAQVEELERRRQTNSSDSFALYLRLEPTIIGLHNFNELRSEQPLEPRVWDIKYGPYAEIAWFSSTKRSENLRVDIETSTWVNKVLPGLGYERVRLVEINFPPPLPGRPNSAKQFDKAKEALDTRRYEDCVAASRGLLEMWTKQLGASRSKSLAETVAEQLGWPSDDKRRDFLDSLWKAMKDFSNEFHHSGNTHAIEYRDARLALLLTALLSEYIGSISP